MAAFMRGFLRFVLRGALSLMALAMVLLILLQIALVAGLNFFNAGKAHDYIAAQVDAAVAGSGYEIAFDRLAYDPVRGLSLYGLSVADARGTLMTLDRLSARIAFSKIPLRELDIAASAGTLAILRLPDADKAEGPDKAGALQPFEAPDIFFRTIRIARLSVEKLDLAEGVAGAPLVFSPSLRGRVALTDKIDANLVLSAGAGDAAKEMRLPEDIAFRGALDPATLELFLEKLDVVSPDYTLEGSGKGFLGAGGTLDYRLEASWGDLRGLTQGELQSASVSMSVAGSYDHPALRATGEIKTAALRDRGLSDISFAAMAQGVAADTRTAISAETMYRGQPVVLKTIVAYAAPDLSFLTIAGTAPFIDVSGQGKLSIETGLFDGQINVSASDLSHYKELLSLDLAGTLKAGLTLKPAGGLQSIKLAAVATKGRFENISAEKAVVGASLADISSRWPQDADVDVSGLAVPGVATFRNITASVKKKEGGAYGLSVNGSGTAGAPMSFKGTADLSGLLKPIPDLGGIDLVVNLNRSVVTLAGGIGQDKVNLAAATKDFRLADLYEAVPEGMESVRLSGSVVMTGTPAAPVTKASLTAAGLDAGAYKSLSVTAEAAHEGNAARISLSGKGAGIRTLTGQAAVPLVFSLDPFAFEFDPAAALSGKIAADLDMAAIAALFLPAEQQFSGILRADGSIGGTMNAPDASGTLALTDSEFTDTVNGVRLLEIGANAIFTKDTVTVRRLTANDGESGRMEAKGTVSFGAAKSTDLSLTLKKFHLPRSDLANGMLDADLSLKDADGGYAAAGKVDIEEMNVLIPETFQSKIPELNIVERNGTRDGERPAAPVSLAIKVNAPHRVFVRGWGLDAEFGGAIDVTGDAHNPEFNGALSSKRGQYEEFGKRFTLERAELRFQGRIPPSPYLDIEASVPADDVKASVLLTGPVKTPAIAFSSTPALPEDEVLSRILFGRNTAKITPFQAVQLAQTLRRFSGEGGGGFDPLGTLRSATGLDDISIDTDESGNTNVGVGKYLTDKVYLEVEKGKAENSGAANIEIEVSPSISIESKIGQDAQGGAGVFWSRDY